MPENSGTGEITQFPGVSPGAFYGTGFGGSESPDVASATHGPVLASPAVSSVYVSSQLAEGRPSIPVTSGDTSGFSDDLAVHESAIIPGFTSATGIGGGKSLVERRP
jgi:hypothetical protein